MEQPLMIPKGFGGAIYRGEGFQLVRSHAIVAFVGLVCLTGCVVVDGPPATPDNRMPLTVDYLNRRTLHPPRHYDAPDEPDNVTPGRQREYGPESMKLDTNPRSLFATLDAFRAHEPKGANALLALATKKKAKTKTAANEDWLGPDESTPKDNVRQASAGSDERAVETGDGGYKLNFEDAEIKDVLQAVLGKVLGLNYTIAPNVSGRITISSAAPQSRSELLSTLETVLALQGLSMTRSGNSYRIAPMSVGAGSTDAKDPGFGISVVPIEYTSVASMTKLLSGFIVDADGIRIDTAHNAIIIRGPGPRREEIVRAIKAFDGDWMHHQSASVFELKRAKPDEVIAELTKIFDADKDGEAAGIIQFKAIKRLRSVMVLSKNEALIRRAATWIRRLDHQDQAATSAVFVYRPRYRDAKELTRLVNGLFGTGSGQGDKDQASGSVAFQSPFDQQGSQGSGSGIGSGSGLGSGGGLSGGGGGGLSGGSTIGTSSSSFAGSLSTPGSGSSLGNSGGGTSPRDFSASTSRNQNGNSNESIDAGGQNQQQQQGQMRLSLTADTTNNTVVAYTDGETYQKVRSVLSQLDMPPLQVAINVIVAEVQLNDELEYGIQFYLNQHGRIGSVGLLDTATRAVTSRLPGFNFILGSSNSPDVLINALDSISKVHVLSSPSIVVSENRPGTFEVGNQVPVITQTATSNLTADAQTINSVQYLDTGIILKIIPRVGQNGQVAMDLDQVISAVVPDASGQGNSLTPTISKRRVSSSISVKSGQTVLLAGLINDNRQQTKGQVPFVGPDLGNFLGNTDNQFTRSELVVFIRPVIVRDADDATAVVEDFRGKLNAMNLNPPPVYKR